MQNKNTESSIFFNSSKEIFFKDNYKLLKEYETNDTKVKLEKNKINLIGANSQDKAAVAEKLKKLINSLHHRKINISFPFLLQKNYFELVKERFKLQNINASFKITRGNIIKEMKKANMIIAADKKDAVEKAIRCVNKIKPVTKIEQNSLFVSQEKIKEFLQKGVMLYFIQEKSVMVLGFKGKDVEEVRGLVAIKVISEDISISTGEMSFLRKRRKKNLERIKEKFKLEKLEFSKDSENKKGCYIKITGMEREVKLAKNEIDSVKKGIISKSHLFKLASFEKPNEISALLQKELNFLKEKYRSTDIDFDFQVKEEKKEIVIFINSTSNEDILFNSIKDMLNSSKQPIPSKAWHELKQKYQEIEDEANVKLETLRGELNIIGSKQNIEKAKEMISSITESVKWTKKKVYIERIIWKRMKEKEINKRIYEIFKNDLSIHEPNPPFSSEYELMGVESSCDKAESFIKSEIMKLNEEILEETIKFSQIISEFFSKNNFSEANSIEQEYNIEMKTMEKQKVQEIPILKASLSFVNSNTNREIKIQLLHGNFLHMQADAIVNPANSGLIHAGGAAKEIENAAGPSLKNECTRLIAQYKEIPTGYAVMTSAGNMQGFNFIIHTVPPVWQAKSTEDTKQLLSNAVTRALEWAESKNLTSIVMPSLGTGIYGIPLAIGSEVIVQSLLNHFSKTPQSSIKLVSIVDIDSTTINAFLQEMNRAGITFNATATRSPQNSPQPNSNDYSQIIIGHQWSWLENNNEFIPYDPDQNFQIERAYQKYLEGGEKSIVVVGDKDMVKNGFSYCVSFPEMLQRNTKTNFARKIIRKPKTEKELQQETEILKNAEKNKILASPTIKTPILLVGSTSSSIGKMKIETHSNDNLSWTLRGFKDSIELAKKKIAEKTSKLIQSKEIKLPDNSQLKTQATEIAKRFGLQFSWSSQNRENILKIEGLKDNVVDAFDELTELKAEFGQSSIIYPPEWEPQSKDLEIKEVKQGSPEWQKITKRIFETMPSLTIHCIERIQNKPLWERYFWKKTQFFDEKNWNDIELFHGTRNTQPSEIYTGSGFDMRFCDNGMWGRGSYFAVNASYSNSYRSTKGDGKFQFFFALATRGDFAKLSSQPNGSLRKPPVKASNDSGIQVEYDSVEGYTGGSIIYIFYENDRVYPSYLITFS